MLPVKKNLGVNKDILSVKKLVFGYKQGHTACEKRCFGVSKGMLPVKKLVFGGKQGHAPLNKLDPANLSGSHMSWRE